MAPRTYVLARLADNPMVKIQAAALRLPANAVFAGHAAAWLHGLELRLADAVEVYVVHDGGVSTRTRMRISRGGLRDDEVVVRGGFRVTTIERTLADLARRLSLTEAVVVTDMALHSGLTDAGKLLAKAVQRAGRPGVRRFRNVLELADGRAESPMESRLRVLLLRAGLPRPESQAELRDASGSFLGRTDLYYPEARLAIEYDGEGHRLTLTEDHRRQNRLIEAGFRVLRFTSPDVYGSSASVVARVRAALAA